MSTEDQFQIGDAVYAPLPTAHGTIIEIGLSDEGEAIYLVTPDWIAHAHHVEDAQDVESEWYSAEDLQHSGTRRPPT
jgi:hypothetical protein